MKNERQYITIKEWFYDKTEKISGDYNCFINKEDLGNELVRVLVEEVLEETEKAVQVRLATGEVVGSYKGWKTWIPKSVIVEA